MGTTLDGGEYAAADTPLSNARGEENVLPRWKIRATTKSEKNWTDRVVQVPAMSTRGNGDKLP